MKKYLHLLALTAILFSLTARSDTTTTSGARVIENSTNNGDLILRLNVGGARTDVVTLSGTTGRAQIAGEAPGGLVPAGSVMMFAGAAAPAGWLLSYGQPIACAGSCATDPVYKYLFATISNTYGGDGTTTFSLPDCRGRTLAGKDDMGGTPANLLTTAGGLSANNTLGATGGAQTTALVEANLAAHTHGPGSGGTEYKTSLSLTGSAPALGGTTTFASTGHNHNMAHNHIYGFINSNSGTGVPGLTFTASNDISTTNSLTGGITPFSAAAPYTVGAGNTPIYTSTSATAYLYTTGVTTSSSATSGGSAVTQGPSATATVTISGGSYALPGSNTVTGTSSPTGSGTAFSNVAPTIVMNCIIKM